jgi:poly-gamma-glutamate capsule biosynthesis protein CapA/YwtB (metallophosphatase superfamily)
VKSLLTILLLIVFSDFTTGSQTGWHRLQPVISSETDAAVVNFTGDCIFTDHFETHVGEDLSSVFAAVPWFNLSDINMINLEHPITLHDEAEEKEFIFKMHPKYLRLLQKGNINLVNAANNHIYDFGIIGIEDTMEFLDSVNIAYVGIGKTLQAAREPVIFTVKGKRLGFLGYFGGKGQYAATDTSAGLAPRFTSLILSDIAKLRPEVDYIIVSYHWGIENERYPEEWQIDLGRASIDAGADLVVGHHPHVIQGIDVYNGGVIVYSLGNFIFGGNRRTVHDTVVLQVLFGDEMIVTPIPVRIDNWRVAELEEDLSRAVIDTLHVYSHDFGNCFFDEYRTYGEK